MSQKDDGPNRLGAAIQPGKENRGTYSVHQTPDLRELRELLELARKERELARLDRAEAVGLLAEASKLLAAILDLHIEAAGVLSQERRVLREAMAGAEDYWTRIVQLCAKADEFTRKGRAA